MLSKTMILYNVAVMTYKKHKMVLISMRSFLEAP